jgi:hypothetical protein
MLVGQGLTSKTKFEDGFKPLALAILSILPNTAPTPTDAPSHGTCQTPNSSRQ